MNKMLAVKIAIGLVAYAAIVILIGKVIKYGHGVPESEEEYAVLGVVQ